MKISALLRFLLAPFLPMYVDDPDAGGADDGASQISGADTIGTGNAARLALLDRINDGNDSTRADEFQDVNDDGSTAAFVAPKTDDEEVDDETIEADVVAPVTEDSVAPAIPKLKVNGVEMDLTPELIEKAQKIASADKYLEDAVTRSKATPAPAPAIKETAPLPSPEDVEKERLNEELALVRAIQMGTEEEAVVALRKIRSTQRPDSLTADDVGRIADERLTFNTAIEWFNTEYADLIEDTNLHAMVLRKDDEAVRSGDKRSYRERYKAIGDEIRGWRDGVVAKHAPAPAAAPAPVANPKDVRKANAPAVPVAANARQKPAADNDEPDESTATVIAKMAQARGGPQWARN